MPTPPCPAPRRPSRRTSRPRTSQRWKISMSTISPRTDPARSGTGTGAATSAAPRRTRRLTYKGEAPLRNSVVLTLIIFNLLLLVIPVAIAFTGSFHNWNPLNGTFDPVGLDNYRRLVTDPRLATSVTNTAAF